MTKQKSTKKTLLTSTLSLVLCVAMLIGTTFAWFTDNVTSTNNIIKSGNLDVELEYWNGIAWKDVEAASDIISGNLWEPGYVDVAYLRLKNAGSLALKYQLGVNIVSETAGVNAAGDTFKLSDYIYFDVAEGVDGETAAYETREDAMEIATETTKISAGYSKAGTLTVGSDYVYLAMIVYMPTTVGNEANHNGTDVPEINLGINVVATQMAEENDSFNNQYDADAIVCDILATPETINEILASTTEGTVIGLAEGYYDEIVLTQDNLTLVSAPDSAVVGFLNVNAKDGATIDGLTFDETGAQETYTFATGNVQKATGYVANITGDTNSPKAADGLVIKNCTFTNTSGVATVAAGSYAPIYFNEQGAATERCDSITIDNCVFACNATQYIALNYMAEGSVVIKNNTFGGATYETSHNTIQATGNAANWTITGNDFNNWNAEKTAIGSSKQGSNKVTWTVTDNNFNHKEGAVILALKTSYTADNSVVIVANNTVLNGNGTIVTTGVNAENEIIYGGHKIQFNNGVKLANNTEELTTSLANDATIVMSEGEYTLPSLAKYEGVTLIGLAGTVIGGEDASTGFASNFGKNTTIKNITFSGSNNGVRWSYAKGGTTTFENCTFAGDSTYGFHIDSSNSATFIFNNCTFSGFNAFAGDLVKVTFNNCTFLNNGSYGHTNIWSVGEFNSCTWGDNTSVSTSGGKAKLFFNGVEESYHHEFIGSADSLFAFAKSVNEGGDSWKGQAVILVDDIDLNNAVWAPIGQTGATEFRGVFDGQNHTISNLNIDSSAQTGEHYSSGLFGWAEAGVTIKNVKVNGATVIGNHNVAVIVGYTYSAKITNCHVTNANIVCNHANADACGDKAGIIGGYVGDEARISNCSATDCSVTAGRDGGQLIGTGYNVSVSNCIATNVTVSATGDCNREGNLNNNIIGRVMG